jgi:ATP-dependent protease Clp ATPase subunit
LKDLVKEQLVVVTSCTTLSEVGYIVDDVVAVVVEYA